LRVSRGWRDLNQDNIIVSEEWRLWLMGKISSLNGIYGGLRE